MLQAIDSKVEGDLVLAQLLPHLFPSLSWRVHQLYMDPKISCEASVTLKNANEERSPKIFVSDNNDFSQLLHLFQCL